MQEMLIKCRKSQVIGMKIGGKLRKKRFSGGGERREDSISRKSYDQRTFHTHTNI